MSDPYRVGTRVLNDDLSRLKKELARRRGFCPFYGTKPNGRSFALVVIRAACDDHPRKVPTRTRAMQRTGTVWGAARQVSSGHRPAEQLGRHIPAVGSSANWNSPPSQSFTLRRRSIAMRPGPPPIPQNTIVRP